jgi:hypothetical protein
MREARTYIPWEIYMGAIRRLSLQGNWTTEAVLDQLRSRPTEPRRRVFCSAADPGRYCRCSSQDVGDAAAAAVRDQTPLSDDLAKSFSLTADPLSSRVGAHPKIDQSTVHEPMATQATKIVPGELPKASKSWDESTDPKRHQSAGKLFKRCRCGDSVRHWFGRAISEFLMKLVVERSGGFAGIRRRGERDWGALSPQHLAALKQIMERGSSLPPDAGADRFTYRVEVQDEGETKQVTVSESAMRQILKDIATH